MAKPDPNRMLVEFDAIFDTDIGIARIMNEDYNNPDLINDKVYGLSDFEYKILFLNRKATNPIKLFLKPVYWNDADSILYQLHNDKDIYDRILKGTTTTSIYDIIREIGIMNKGGIEVTVLCHNQQEAIYSRSVLPDYVKYETSNSWDNSGFDVEHYDTILVKDIDTPKKFNNFMGKNLYVCKYAFNLDLTDKTFENPKSTEYTMYHLTQAIDVYMIDVYGDISDEVKRNLIASTNNNNDVEEDNNNG